MKLDPVLWLQVKRCPLLLPQLPQLVLHDVLDGWYPLGHPWQALNEAPQTWRQQRRCPLLPTQRPQLVLHDVLLW